MAKQETIMVRALYRLRRSTSNQSPHRRWKGQDHLEQRSCVVEYDV